MKRHASALDPTCGRMRTVGEINKPPVGGASASANTSTRPRLALSKYGITLVKGCCTNSAQPYQGQRQTPAATPSSRPTATRRELLRTMRRMCGWSGHHCTRCMQLVAGGMGRPPGILLEAGRLQSPHIAASTPIACHVGARLAAPTSPSLGPRWRHHDGNCRLPQRSRRSRTPVAQLDELKRPRTTLSCPRVTGDEHQQGLARPTSLEWPPRSFPTPRKLQRSQRPKVRHGPMTVLGRPIRLANRRSPLCHIGLAVGGLLGLSSSGEAVFLARGGE
ncbi:hypothetical protein EDB80DRAFT_129484 [Ilyonectria destructans]|nr:hypothetical protein EDB80DRAFT_129484 [Ilyonectria destructans]